MKSINIAALKGDLSRVLRRVRRGERYVVLDRSEPVAELIPVAADHASAYERLVREGKVRAPTRRLRDVRISPVRGGVRIQDLLRQVREDSV